MKNKYSRIINKTFFLILMMIVFVGGINASTINISVSPYHLKADSTGAVKQVTNLTDYTDAMYYKYDNSSKKSYICYTGLWKTVQPNAECKVGTLPEKQSIALGYIINTMTGRDGGIASLSNETTYYWAQMSSLIYLGGDHAKDITLDLIKPQINTVSGKTMDELTKSANEYAEKYIKNISLQLSESGLNFELAGEYYVSQKVYLEDVNNNIDDFNITTNNENFEITRDKDNTGDFFQVKIKKSNITGNEANVTITVNASNEYYAAIFYDCSKSDSQDLLATETEKKSKTATASISGTITITNKVVITKVDATNKKELPGATLEIQNEQGEIVKYCSDLENSECKWVSTEEPYMIEGLPNGTYYLVETIAPEGYVLNKEKVKFELKGDEAISYVQMTNELEVQVPDTLSSRSVLLVVISMFDIALGIGILIYVKNSKLRNE